LQYDQGVRPSSADGRNLETSWGSAKEMCALSGTKTRSIPSCHKTVIHRENERPRVETQGLGFLMRTTPERSREQSCFEMKRDHFCAEQNGRHKPGSDQSPQANAACLGWG
jgi:hypothetical protein